MSQAWRSHLARWVWADETMSAGARSFAAATMVGVVALVVATIGLTVPGLAPPTAAALASLRWIAVVLLSLEYALRLWTAPMAAASSAAPPSSRAYFFSFLGLVDLVAVAPFWLALATAVDDGVLIAAGLIAVLKLARYAPGLPLVATVLRNEWRSLMAALLVVLVLLVLAAGAMYLLEREAQPMAFASIAHALWWAVVTIASVGYGDVTPVTPLGRLLAGVVMLIGIALFAVPAGILATGFAGEIRRRDFVVTWQLVSQVPLFAGLDAARIAEIARLLRPIIVPQNSVIVRRGETADAMYFIVEGEAEVDVTPRPVRLGKGQFFGEIALIKDIARTATVTAASECQLLALSIHDFRRLMERQPELKAQIAREAERRQAELPHR